jgi:hypothetical protein
MINLISMEYFFFLEFIRPILIWNALSTEQLQRNKRIRLTVRYWLPYFMLFLLVLIWRLFFSLINTRLPTHLI